MRPGAPVGPSVTRPRSWACCVLCLSPESSGQGHLLVTPGSIPLNSAPGIPDPNQGFRPALVPDLGGECAKIRSIGTRGSSLPAHASQGRMQLSDSRPEGQSLSKHVLSPASSGSWIPAHCCW